MTKRTNYVGPCATACKPGAGTDSQRDTFDRIIVAAAEHAAREAGLPGRADRAVSCATCAHASARQSIDWRGCVGTPVTWYSCTVHLDCIDGDHYQRRRC